MQACTTDSALLYRDAEIVEFFLLLLFQLHLDQSGLVFILRQDYIVPFVLEFLDLGLMCVLKRVHFLFLQEIKCQNSSH